MYRNFHKHLVNLIFHKRLAPLKSACYKRLAPLTAPLTAPLKLLIKALTLTLIVYPALAEVRAPVLPQRGVVIAIGDLHADLKGAQEVFRIAGVTDEQGRWVARGVTVVQTGDLTDRGPDGEPLLRWIKGLEVQAEAYESRFVVLLGNHEVMNLHGDWRYVSAEDVQSFGGVERRKALLALSHGGEWARWLLTQQAVVRVGETLFVHGGISQNFIAPAPQLSAQVTAAILSQPRHPILGERGPLWYRGYWLNSEEEACAEAERVLNALGAQRMVMGHTTQRDGRVHSRCGGRLYAIDTGISRVYGGHPAALKLSGGEVFALYRGGAVKLSP